MYRLEGQEEGLCLFVLYRHIAGCRWRKKNKLKKKVHLEQKAMMFSDFL